MSIEHGGHNPEMDEDGLTPEQRAYAEGMMTLFQDELPKLEQQEIGKELAELKKQIEAFEAAYSLEELHAITHLSAKDAPNHPVREPARKALIPIDKLYKLLKESMDTGSEEFKEATEQYKKVTNAVGWSFGTEGGIRHESI